MPAVRLSLAKEKAHLELLGTYSQCEETHLITRQQDLNNELGELVSKMNVGLTAITHVRYKHRVALRRLAERKEMLDVCFAKHREDTEWAEGNTHYDSFMSIIGYVEETLDRIETLINVEGLRVVTLINYEVRLQL